MVEKKASRFTIVNKRDKLDAEATLEREEKKGEEIILKKRKRKERSASPNSSDSEQERKKKKKKKHKKDKAHKRAKRSRSRSDSEKEKNKPERWVPPEKNMWTGLPFSPKYFDIL